MSLKRLSFFPIFIFLFVWNTANGQNLSKSKAIDSKGEIKKSKDTIKNDSYKYPQTSIIRSNPKIDSLQALLKKNKQDTNRVNILNKLCVEYMNVGLYDTAMIYDNIAMQLSRKLNFKKGTAKVYNNMGNIFYYQSNYFEALENYAAFLNLSKELKNPHAIAAAYNNIGSVYNILGNFSEALKNYYASLEIKENNQNDIAISYNNIGLIYEMQNNFSEALKKYFIALEIFKKLDEKESMASSYSNIGNVYAELHDKSKALENHLASLKISENINDKEGIISSLCNIGADYMDLGNYSEALKKYKNSLSLCGETTVSWDIAKVFMNIGEVQIKLKNMKEAQYYLNSALLVSKKIGSKDFVEHAYFDLSGLDSIRGNWKAAYEDHKLFTFYKDSIDNDETKKKTIQTAMTYEFSKKEAVAKGELDLKELSLQKEKSDKKLAYGLILLLITGGGAGVWLFIQRRKTEKVKLEKDKFEMQLKWFDSELKALRSQMNPHFIFNCMASIQRFMLENDTASASKFLSKFARLIRSILENSELPFISLEAELKVLEDYLDLEKLRFGKKFVYLISVDDDINTEMLEIPSMLIQPYIENAIIHGIAPDKTEKGKIEINFKIIENILRCEIIDNGIGRKKAAELKAQMGLSHKSMGLSIIKERLELINAKENLDVYAQTIDLEDDLHVSLGTKVELNIPLRERKLQ